MKVEKTWEVESESLKWRDAENDIEKHWFKIQMKDEEVKREIKKNEDLTHQIDKMREEIRSFEMILREKEMLSTTLTWQLDEVWNELRMREHEFKSKISQMANEEKERQTLERWEKSYLQKEMEEMEQKCLEIEMKRRTEVEMC